MNWFMVVMDDVRDCYQTCFDHVEHTVELKEKIPEALRGLHSKGYVHGDVRDINVMFSPASSQVMLVDFDWSSVAGKVQYPSGINRSTVFRPQSVQPDGPIIQQHDIDMVDIMFGGVGDAMILAD
jgi:DNA-binding helix-hairpin-helix protein with protein kinase domain